MQVKIKGNFMEFYDSINDCLEGPDCPLQYENASLIFIDEDEVVFEVNELSRIVRVNGIGEIEEVIYE